MLACPFPGIRHRIVFGARLSVTRILLIEDDPGVRTIAQERLRARGHEVTAVDAADALNLLHDGGFDLVVAGMEGAAAAAPPPSPAPAAPPVVVLNRPMDPDALVQAVTEHETWDLAQRRIEAARHHMAQAAAGEKVLVGDSPAMRHMMARLAAVAESSAPVLLTGESGTGKELIASIIKTRGPRADGPFVAVNCAAFPDTLLEAELFGHERGAFTGAFQRREGRFKAAHGGTLFLDEVNGLSLGAQAKLLRVLQDGSFQPIGTNTTHVVDVRLISATNRELKTLVAEGKFREDLYYRIKVLDVEVPPLREREGDLPLLVAHFLRKHGKPDAEPAGITPRAWAALAQHDFPGNVRELEHAIQHAVVLARGGEIDLEHLPRDLVPLPVAPVSGEAREIRPILDAIREFEREYLLRALRLAGGNKTRAAKLLGISRKNLWERLRRVLDDLAPEDWA
jgi:DNA-binding NtrC family response regulator